MEYTLCENERLDEVNEHLQLIQKTDGLVFGTDALLLAAYIDRSFDRVCDIGTGCGIISLLLLCREKAAEITALEIQPAYADLAARNAAGNGFSHRMQVVCDDVRRYAQSSVQQFDLVLANPPYMRSDSGYMCDIDAKTAARHEIHGTIDEFCRAAARMVRYGGYFAVVYRPDRLTDLLCALRDAGMEPKRMTFVCADAQAAPSMVLVLAKRGAAAGVRLSRPLLLHTDSTHKHNTDAFTYILDHGRFPADFFADSKRKIPTKKEDKEHGNRKE